MHSVPNKGGFIMAQYIEKAPIIAPGVIDELDDNGNFVVRHYDGRYFDQNGDEIYDYNN